jgi:hypothetical protein
MTIDVDQVVHCLKIGWLADHYLNPCSSRILELLSLLLQEESKQVIVAW